jgi:sugar lactone lactonase YvrE
LRQRIHEVDVRKIERSEELKNHSTLEAMMTAPFAPSRRAPRFWRMLNFFPLALACALLPVTSQAQVTFKGTKPNVTSVNLGSQAVGASSAAASLSFTIAANTKVGSIGVLTTGIVAKDFTEATGSTCTATTYTADTNCTVNVTFRPAVAGLRMGAVVFFSGASKISAVLASVPVFGIGSGPQLIFGTNNTQSSVGSGLLSPEAVALDAAGDVYIADIGLQEVFKVTPAGEQTTLGTGLEVPGGVAVDGAGNVYIADSQAAVVWKVTPSGVQTTVGKNFQYPFSVAVDGEDNVYVSDPFVPTVFKVTPRGKMTTVGTGYNTPNGVAVDSAGNVYVADPYSQAVFKVTRAGEQTTVGTGLIDPTSVAVDAAGDVYITDAGTDDLYEVTPSGVQTAAAEDLDIPSGIALDGAGNLYLVNTFSEHVLKIGRTAAPTLSFESTKINTTSQDSPKIVEIENIGNEALKFSALSYPVDFPEDSLADNCTASTALAATDTCTLAIDFSPVTSLGSNSSAVLTEAVKWTTNNLNATRATEQVTVTGKEIK